MARPDVHDPLAPFRIGDYRMFVLMVLTTTVIQQAQSVAIGWDLYERTGSALALGVIGLAQFIPVILFFLPAGQLADQYDRRRIVVLSLVFWGGANLILAVVSMQGAAVGWFYLAAVGIGAAQVVHRPARDALMPQLVPPAMLESAVAWNSSLFGIASIGGPAMAGALIAATGTASSVYSLNVALAVAAGLLALAIERKRIERAPRSRSMRDLLAGLVHVWRTKAILGVITLDLFAVLLGGATALLPIFAKDILQVGPAELGWLSSATAIGGFAMSVTQGLRRPFRRAGMTFVWSVAGFGIATIVFGLSTWFWLSLFALMAAGAFDNVSVVIRATVVQLHTPDDLRGRVSAVNRVFISSSNELGAFESGLLAALTNPVFTVVFGGVATVAFVLGALRLFPELSRMGRVAGG
jgi:MFS family permease